jgi:small GTP-binding protein
MVRVVVHAVNGTAIHTNRETGESLRDLRAYLETDHGFKPEHQRLYQDGTELCGVFSLQRIGQSYAYQEGVNNSAQACWTGMLQWFWSNAKSDDAEEDEPELALDLVIDTTVLRKPASTHRLRGGADKVFIKFVLVGDSAVGKTALLERYVDGTVPSKFTTPRTTGMDFKIKRIDIEGHAATLQLWDINGGERFRSFNDLCYRGASGIIVCYDVTCRNAFQNIPRWLERVRKSVMRQGISKMNCMLVGNKCGVEEHREIPFNEGEALALKYGIPFAEVDAELGVGIDEAFLRFAAQALDPLLEERQVVEEVVGVGLPMPIGYRLQDRCWY